MPSEVKDEIKQSIDQRESFNPICPYCETDPIQVNVRQLAFGNGIVVLLACCGNKECRKVISASFMGMAQPKIVTPNFSGILQ